MTYTKEQVLAILEMAENQASFLEGTGEIEELNNVAYWIRTINKAQRKRLENMKPKKTREVIKYC